MIKYTLYKKVHKKTGLQYLGYTTKNPYDYAGSGKYWKRHIKIHGNDVETIILCETYDKKEITERGIYYSEMWNVVDSDNWANLKPESGDGGTFSHRKDSIEKIRDYQKNKKIWTEKAIQNLKDITLISANKRRGQPWTEERRLAGNRPNEETMMFANKKRSDTLKGRKTSKGREGHKYPDEDKISCEHCDKKLIPGYYHRYHGDKCKLKDLS